MKRQMHSVSLSRSDSHSVLYPSISPNSSPSSSSVITSSSESPYFSSSGSSGSSPTQPSSSSIGFSIFKPSPGSHLFDPPEHLLDESGHLHHYHHHHRLHSGHLQSLLHPSSSASSGSTGSLLIGLSHHRNMGTRTFKKYLLLAVMGIFLVGFLYQFNSPTCFTRAGITEYVGPERFIMTNEDGKDIKFTYNRNTPLIFIGGMPRSGTTLLRVLLDAHPDIRCGEETRLVPRILGYRQMWMKYPFETKRLAEAGISAEVLDSAVAAFILEIIAKHGTPSPRLCNKDPFTIRTAVYLNELFPNSKFIFMIRDGRAVVHSIISRKVTISGFDLSNYNQCMEKWNQAMMAMNAQCQKLGPKICLPVHYEQLVLHPKVWMEKILNFLQVPWNESVLHHEQLIDKPGGISLSKLERSTDQVIKPINIEALSKWVGHIPEDALKQMDTLAPMLNVFGYDPHANPPDYGKPDSFVLKKMEDISLHHDVYESKEKEIIGFRESMASELRGKPAESAAENTIDTKEG